MIGFSDRFCAMKTQSIENKIEKLIVYLARFLHCNKCDKTYKARCTRKVQMLKLKTAVKERRLLLGDYVTVHVSGIEEIRSQLNTTYDIRFRRKVFLKRSERARPELNNVKKNCDAMINTAYRQSAVLKDSCSIRKAS